MPGIGVERGWRRGKLRNHRNHFPPTMQGGEGRIFIRLGPAVGEGAREIYFNCVVSGGRNYT
jgi:hypothetical protein